MTVAEDDPNRIGTGDFRDCCPNLSAAVESLVADWLAPVLARQEDIIRQEDEPPRLKLVNDPVWRTYELEPHEVLLVDSPLLQRMRGVKQLGLANLVFPGANHDRFEHLCGTVEGAERIFYAIKTNADRRREAEEAANRILPKLEMRDRLLLRLAALLHDVGHGPFSHAIEPVVARRYAEELGAFNLSIAQKLHLDAKVSIAELISVLVVTGATMKSVLEKPPFDKLFQDLAVNTQVKLAILILGGRHPHHLPCLSAIISGQVDADKLDYMARDALHSGMPIEFDTDRLLRKLEVVRCTPENLPANANQKINRRFAEESPNKQYFDLGLAAAGVGALEQMLIGRAFLYDRLYHHHKVRAADAMAQRMLHYRQQEPNPPESLRDLYLPVSDDTLIRIIGNTLTPNPTDTRSGRLARAILARNLYVRAFAFRASFHPISQEELDDEERRTAALAEAWSPVSTGLADLEDRLKAEAEIVAIARRVGAACESARLNTLAKEIDESHVIVDLAENRIKPVTINIHGEDGSLEPPNLFFDPARWSHVYDLQKRTGYVFCDRRSVPLVALATKIYFFERWGYSVTEKADRLTKTLRDVKQPWLDSLKEVGELDCVTFDVLRRAEEPRLFIHENQIEWPGIWRHENPDIDAEIVDALRNLLPQGMGVDDRAAVITTIGALASFVASVHADSSLVTGVMKEADLQQILRRHLRARNLQVTEGSELGGGETDLIVENRSLIENKIIGQVTDPFSAKPATAYQANRYNVALCSRVSFSVIGYKPAAGADPIEQTSSIQIRLVKGLLRTAVEVAVVIPYGMPVPSKVKPIRA